MDDKIKITNNTVLSHNWGKLTKIEFDYRKKDGTWETQRREVYDRGNGVAVLLYNKAAGTVILTRQFRLPTYVNGNSGGMLLEACAGHLDEDHPEAAAIRETEEETGYRVSDVQKVFEAYMSPGAFTEILHFFVAAYTPAMKVSEGGGQEEEHEEIDVLEMPFAEALHMVKTGAIRDAKTIMLLQYAQINKLV